MQVKVMVRYLNEVEGPLEINQSPIVASFVFSFQSISPALEDCTTVLLLFSLPQTHLFLGTLQNIFYCPTEIIIN